MRTVAVTGASGLVGTVWVGYRILNRSTGVEAL